LDDLVNSASIEFVQLNDDEIIDLLGDKLILGENMSTNEITKKMFTITKLLNKILRKH
jgi:hypothetical protein